MREDPARKDSGVVGPRHILVVRTDRIGDFVLSLSAIQAIRTAFPDARLDVMVSPDTRELAERSPAIDHIIVDDMRGDDRGPRGFIQLLRRVRRESYDVVLLLHPTTRLAALFFLSGIRQRIGTGYRLYSLFFTRRVWHHRRRAERHESEYCLELAGTLGADQSPHLPSIVLSEEDRRWASGQAARWSVGDDLLVVIHPGSGGSARDWSPENYRELVRHLAGRPGVQVAVTGSQDEAQLVTSVAGAGSGRAHSLAGGASLGQFAALLQGSALVVTNSTGPLHLASAVGTATVSIFCPIVACSPKRWGPMGEGHRVFVPDVPPCDACTGQDCAYYDCMDRVRPEEVVATISSILGRPAAEFYQESHGEARNRRDENASSTVDTGDVAPHSVRSPDRLS